MNNPVSTFIQRRRGQWRYIGVAAAACVLLMILNLPLFLKAVSLAGTALFVFSLAVMLLTFRKAKRISPWSLLISVVFSLASLWIYSLFLGVHFATWVKLVSMAGGCLIGIGWALTTPVRVRNGVVEREGTLWYLAVWGLILSFNQVVTTLTGRPPHVAMVLLLLGTGVVVGNSGSLIWQFVRVRGRSVVLCLTLALALTSLASPASGQMPPSPASLNIRPLYEDLWLPPNYAPANFRCDNRPPSPTSQNPPRISGWTEFFLWEVPFPSHGGQIDPASNVDDWRRVNISSMTLYATAQNAHDVLLYYAYQSYPRPVAVGDEGLFNQWTERPWPNENRSALKSYDKDHVWDSRATDGFVRVGRLLLRMSVRGGLMIDRVDADTGQGFKRFQGFITLAEVPSREELEQDMSQFASAIRSYAGTMGWLTDAGSSSDRKGSSSSLPPVTPGEKAGGNSSSPPVTPGEKEGDSNSWPPVTPGQAAGGALATGLLGLLGNLLMTKASGVSLGESVTPLTKPSRFSVGETVPPHQDGDVNESGDVWSKEDRGWIERNLYDQERARRTHIDEVNEEALHTRDAGVQAAHDAWLESKRNLERTVTEGREKLIRKLDLLDRIAQNERDQDHFSYTSEVVNNFQQNVTDDLKELANDARWTMTGVFQGFDMGLMKIRDAASNPQNWKAVAKGTLNTAIRYANPINALSDSGKVIGKTLLVVNAVGRHMVLHPLDTAITITGYENWKKAMDYHEPISKRLGCAVMGAVDTTLTFGGTILKGVEMAGTAVKGMQQAAEINRLQAGLELTHAEQVRKGAWISGAAEADANVTRFLKNPNDAEALKAIQADHRAIQAINRQPESVRRAFNEAMAQRNAVAEAATKARLETKLADEGVDLSKHEVQVRHATNPSTKVKVGADNDITYSLYDKQTGQWVRDVPAEQVKGIHSDEYYKAWNNGKQAATAEEAEAFAKGMRQEHVSNLSADAYGRNPGDLETVLKHPDAPLHDSQQVGQAMGYKTGNELREAGHLRNSEGVAKTAAETARDAKKAEEVAGYGYRQTTKQAENILDRRAAAARDAGRLVKDTPEHLKFGLELIKRVEGSVPGAAKMSPVEAEKIFFAKTGKSLDSVAYEIGERVEALEKLK